MRPRALFLRFLLATIAPGWAAAAGAPAPATRTITFAEASCNTLAELPITFSIPASYVTRAPAQHRTKTGCFWGIAADLDRAMKDPKGIDFSGIRSGVFWARPAGNVGFDRRKNQFYDGRGADEAGMKRQFERAGAKNAVAKRGAVGRFPTLQFTGDLPAGPNHKEGRLYMIYIGLGTDTNTLLLIYHPPTRQTPADDQVWEQFISSLRSTAPQR